MRLIDTTTLQFEDVQFEDHMHTWEKYAILSHRWGDDEVSHQDYLDKKKHTGSGYAKIINFCRLAKQNGLDWAWVRLLAINLINIDQVEAPSRYFVGNALWPALQG